MRMGSALEIVTPSGRRRWPLDQLMSRAKEGRISVGELVDQEAGATHATFESNGGDYRASIPLEVARDQGAVVVEKAGGLRLVVEDGATLCWNVKDLGRIRLTIGKEPDSIPEDPSH
jgi:hypothetical protein